MYSYATSLEGYLNNLVNSPREKTRELIPEKIQTVIIDYPSSLGQVQD